MLLHLKTSTTEKISSFPLFICIKISLRFFACLTKRDFHGMLWQTNFPQKHQQSSQKWRKIIEIKMNKKQKFVSLVEDADAVWEMKISGAPLLPGISNHMNARFSGNIIFGGENFLLILLSTSMKRNFNVRCMNKTYSS